MAKGPAVIGVLTEPSPPSWWQANRHKACLALGLIVGCYIGIHTSDAAPQHAGPRPGHTAPAAPSARPSPAGN
ncbi:hypothetical protein DV517_74700 [Streptomyces sp. S816]|uniref:hypothetical protein n=1 Tax=Streptomyces sp. S816 TaxID=2283197 RepID=UPI00109CF03F|nr:hypothetical protein [Streptomyces sp. S816]TGZ12375.1 hypothetical protein DV517_74700 [Streptomyces sp. S816]